MAVAYSNGTYLGSTGFDSSHTISAFNCSGTDSHLAVVTYQRLVTTEVAGVTANGNAMTGRGGSENTNVAGVKFWDYTINNGSFNVVASTPAFKLCGVSAIALTGINQTTPAVGTPVTAGGFGTTATASGVTQIHNQDHSNASLGQCFVGYVVATGSSQTIGCTSASGDNWQLSIVELAASGPAAPPFIRAAIFF
jgi:hypothetical protein